MNIEDLLRPIIAEIVNKMNKRILLFISGGAVNLKGIFETLSSMQMLQYDIVMTEASKKVIPEEYIANLNGKLIDCKVELTKAVREDDIIIVPIMTRNTLAKCAAGIEDNLVTTGIAEAIMMNKEVIAVKDSFDPQNQVNISLGFNKNAAYNKLILGYEDKLTSFGVKFINAGDIKRTINARFSIMSNANENLNHESVIKNTVVNKEETCNIKKLSGILTIEDIMLAANNSKEIWVKEGSLLTPLAKDYIYNNGINVNYC
ncbi:flavoprotein [Clostridium sp. BSD9I1]|uniref:flavoprotein n=1 Tax=Clostridium sp. BSD9I1 TaxID=2003589 RepID=UPI001648B6EB|nr:flavoprotein [Clostridium sp. BSD9I1]